MKGEKVKQTSSISSLSHASVAEIAENHIGNVGVRIPFLSYRTMSDDIF